MSLSARDRQVIASIEARLTESDPDLAAQFELLNRPQALAGGLGRVKGWFLARRKVIALVTLSLAIVAAVLASLPSSGQAGNGCGAATLSCAQTEYGCYGVSGIRRPAGAPPVCRP